MRKRKNLKVQPLKSAKLSEEERQLRLLGLQFGEALRQFEMIRASVVNLEREFIRLSKLIQQLQKQAEIKRVEAQIGKGRSSSPSLPLATCKTDETKDPCENKQCVQGKRQPQQNVGKSKRS